MVRGTPAAKSSGGATPMSSLTFAQHFSWFNRLHLANFTYHTTLKSLPAANSPKSKNSLRVAYVAQFTSAKFTYHTDKTIIKFENGGTNLDRYKSYQCQTLKQQLFAYYNFKYTDGKKTKRKGALTTVGWKDTKEVDDVYGYLKAGKKYQSAYLIQTLRWGEQLALPLAKHLADLAKHLAKLLQPASPSPSLAVAEDSSLKSQQARRSWALLSNGYMPINTNL
ncbi:hypothetical protein LXL04_014215 [Taraxacum kok-saghyz]